MQADTKGIDRLAYSIADALTIVPVGRSMLYEEIRAGRLRTFKIGSRTLIADEDLRAWLLVHRRQSRVAQTGGSQPQTKRGNGR